MSSVNRERFYLTLTICFLWILIPFLSSADAAEVNLNWSKPADSRVVGYNIYYGSSETTFKSSPAVAINSADQTSCPISGLTEGLTYYFAATSRDVDGNESDYSATVSYLVKSTLDTDDDGDGYTENQGDCNDGNPSIHLGATEICGDGIDQDCNGSDLVCPEDRDDDGDGYTEIQGDCNDNNPSIHPGASEICGDGIDQDCDGSDLVCPGDVDDDGDGFTENAGDCNDNAPSIHPGAIEICGDGIDQDCDGADLLCTAEPGTYKLILGDTPGADYPASVQDTFLNLNTEVNTASEHLNTYTWPANMPANAVLIKFALPDLPAGSRIESATLTLYQTASGGDASYDVSVHKVIHYDPDLYAANGYTYDGANPWTANDAAYNGIPLAQADIAPAEDVNSLDQSFGYKQWDITGMVQDWINLPSSNNGLMLNSDAIASADSYRYFASNEAIDAAQRPRLEITYSINTGDLDDDGDGYTKNQGDCDDTDATVHPGAIEICGDGIDQDCNGSDLTCPEEIDDDGDGYTEIQGDCNDSNPSINPGATEICGDGIDQDCNGSDLICLEGLDSDNDGFSVNQGDCDDEDPSIHPGASETCGDGIDQDCNGSDLTCPEEIDEDGDGYTENEGDCNDNDATQFPGAIEVCDDGIDQDCNGKDLTCVVEQMPDLIIETGEIEIDHEWQFVAYNKTFNAPVVVSGPMSLNEDDPAVVRIRNVSQSGFEIRIQEWEYLDGVHAKESVSYLVLESGRHQLADGTIVEAGTFETNSTSILNFDGSFNQVPVVLSAVTTNNDVATVTGRIYNVSINGFSFDLQQQEKNKKPHKADETITYIAWEPSLGVIEGISYEVDLTPAAVTNSSYHINFNQDFTELPAFVVETQTMNAKDTANIRWQNKKTGGVDILIDEEQSRDKDESHTAEVVGYIIFE